jgi:hypothetical protein
VVFSGSVGKDVERWSGTHRSMIDEQDGRLLNSAQILCKELDLWQKLNLWAKVIQFESWAWHRKKNRRN